MSYLQILSFVLTGAGTLASILGIFFAVYAKQNGRVTREFIAQQSKEAKEFTERVIKEVVEEMDVRWQKTWKEMDERGLETQRILAKMDERAEQRHKEVMAKA